MDTLITAANQVPGIFDIRGKLAVVTGAAGGIGEAISMALAAAGAELMLIDLNESSLQKLANTIEANFGMKVRYSATSVTDEAGISGVAQGISDEGRSVDILVSCAGIAVLAPALDLSVEDWRRGMAVNLEGTYICCREFGRLMVGQGYGKIVNISSVRGSQGRPDYSSYAPSKAGVNLLTKTLACEWSASGVNVNAIAPIFIRTEMNASILDDPIKGPDILKRIPKGRLGRTSDLFGAVIYLASPASDFVTGTILYVDGGWTAA